MQPKKTRWSRVYESSEEELTDFLRSRKLAAERHTLSEFETTEQQTTPRDVTLWCAEGSMTVQTDSTKLSIQPGDSIQLPAGTVFALLAGISGCVYYESTS
jgi:quercetin dioxygenase-like cupin family protein